MSLCVIKDHDTCVINCYACRTRALHKSYLAIYACLQPSIRVVRRFIYDFNINISLLLCFIFFLYLIKDCVEIL
jgi:hypothetical protein